MKAKSPFVRSYQYMARIIDVHDGDTVLADIDLGCRIHHHAWLRLARINTRETNAQTEKSRALAATATAFVKDNILGKEVQIFTQKDGRTYDRLIAEINFFDGTAIRNLSDVLLSLNLAEAYKGGKVSRE